MQSLLYVKGSNGAANASQMTVQTVRAPGATTNTVNTVAGVPTFFYGSMGAPHTFTDPVTGETITIISEATAVDFAGTINAGKIDIVAIAPGYSDSRGSLVGDIIVVRPITEWANNIFNVLNQSHNDDGSFKNDSIANAAMFADPVDPVLRASERLFDHVASGAVLAGLGYGSTLTASLSAGVCYINGNRQLIAAVATRTYTASKDTYVDLLYNASGTATVVYTEVANNTVSPALAANSIRLGIVVSGANIAAAASINQGQEDRVVPIVSSVAYSVTDGLGNLICPRDPNRKLLGYREITADYSTAAAGATAVPGLTVPVIVPAGRKIKVTVFFPRASNSSSVYVDAAIYEGATAGALTTGRQSGSIWSTSTGRAYSLSLERTYTPANSTLFLTAAAWAEGGGSIFLNAATFIGGSAGFIRVELE